MKISKKSMDKIERLIEISKNTHDKYDPQTFIPWNIENNSNYIFIPEELLSLGKTELFNKLSKDKQRKLAHAEIMQVMYSYAWSEGLACHFFYRAIQQMLDVTSPVYRYLLIEAEEEARHQQMFARVIKDLDGKPIPPTRMHRFAGWFATRFLPNSFMYISVLGIELVTDAYGEGLRSHSDVHPILRKVSQLHNIEEARHMCFAEIVLEQYLDKAGIFRKSLYSIVICLNIYFMRTLYVRREIFEIIGLDSKIYYKSAKKELRLKFNVFCLKKAEKFVDSFNGFNYFTKLIWKIFLK